jgi:ribonucleotide reductase alpha subunit
MEIVNPVMEMALYNLGYSEKEIGEILTYLLEKDSQGYFLHEGVAGAPHIKAEHLPIFDTANTISPMGHVLMVSAITPMISGSVSKTVNLPNDASVEDVENIHLLAYRTGTKAIAIYRDACKASQPLSSGMAEEHDKVLDDYSYAELLALVKGGSAKALNRVRPEGMRPKSVISNSISRSAFMKMAASLKYLCRPTRREQLSRGCWLPYQNRYPTCSNTISHQIRFQRCSEVRNMNHPVLCPDILT